MDKDGGPIFSLDEAKSFSDIVPFDCSSHKVNFTSLFIFLCSGGFEKKGILLISLFFKKNAYNFYKFFVTLTLL